MINGYLQFDLSEGAIYVHKAESKIFRFEGRTFD